MNLARVLAYIAAVEQRDLTALTAVLTEDVRLRFWSEGHPVEVGGRQDVVAGFRAWWTNGISMYPLRYIDRLVSDSRALLVLHEHLQLGARVLEFRQHLLFHLRDEGIGEIDYFVVPDQKLTRVFLGAT